MSKKKNNKREEVKRRSITLKQESKSKWKTPSKWKEEEKYYLYKFVTFKYNLYTHSLSFTLMAKLKLEEEGNNNNYNS